MTGRFHSLAECAQCRDFYLFDSSGQVLDKKPSEVVECLQLSGLCEGEDTQFRAKHRR